MPTGLMIIIFLAVTTGSAAIFMMIGSKKENPRTRTLRRLGVSSTVNRAEAPSSVLKRDILQKNKAGKKRFSIPKSKGLNTLLEKSGCGIQANVFLMLCISMAAIGAGATFLANRSPVSAAAAGLVLGVIPYAYVRVKYRKRAKLLTEQFPDSLEMLTSTLRAGQAFSTGLMTVAEEMPEPISSEFRMTFEEQNYGVPLNNALQNLAGRVDTMDMDFFVTAVNIQRETGGNLAEILDNLGKTIRERFRIIGQIKTLTAQGRLSGFIIGSMPLGLGLMLTILNPGYMNTLFSNPLGRVMLIISGVMQVMGFLWINKIVKIKV